jgi:hypothetical protein
LSGRLQTSAVNARNAVNPLSVIAIGDGPGLCRLYTQVNATGLVSTETDDPTALDCPDLDEVEKAIGGGEGPACAPPPPLGYAAATPDLKPVGDFAIGGHSVGWGDSVELLATSAAFRALGRCYFPYRFSVRNAGTVAAGASTAAVLNDSAFGMQLDAQAVPPLPALDEAQVMGLFGLPPGKWRVFARADASEQVAETNGQNNARWVRVRVTGNCSAAPAP